MLISFIHLFIRGLPWNFPTIYTLKLNACYNWDYYKSFAQEIIVIKFANF